MLTAVFLIIMSRKFYGIKYFRYIFMFLVLLLVSQIWSVNLMLSLSMFRSVFITIAISFSLFTIIIHSNSQYFTVGVIAFSGLFLGVYSLFFYGPIYIIESIYMGRRLGQEITQINIYGMRLAFSSIILLFLSRKSNKILYIFFSITLMLLVLASGSKKALIIILGYFVLNFFMYTNKVRIFKRVIAIIVLTPLLIPILDLILNIDLFSMIISRFESFIYIFIDFNRSDASSRERMNLIWFGFELIRNKPIFGYGLDSFSYLYGTPTGYYLYSHNNYIELLVSVGIVGLITYYNILLHLIIRIKRKLMSSKPTYAKLFIIFIVLFLLLDLASVSMNDRFNYSVIALIFSFQYRWEE